MVALLLTSSRNVSMIFYIDGVLATKFNRSRFKRIDTLENMIASNNYVYDSGIFGRILG